MTSRAFQAIKVVREQATVVPLGFPHTYRYLLALEFALKLGRLPKATRGSGGSYRGGGRFWYGPLGTTLSDPHVSFVARRGGKTLRC